MIFRSAIAFTCLSLALAGCHVSSNKNGKNDNVDIGTPFGSMHVKTDDAANLAGLGLTPYPGAVPDKTGSKDGKAADIDMSFGKFHLGVKAATLLSGDSEDKVTAFYRKDLARYGDVLTCRNNEPIGQPARTAQGLGCNDQSSHSHAIDEDSLELRAGSPTVQHIVGVKVRDGQTRIGLVALNLPDHINTHDAKDSE